MKIGINVSFLRKRGSGIGEVTYHFVRTLLEDMQRGKYGDIQIVFYAEEESIRAMVQSLPSSVRERCTVRAFLPPLYTRDDLVRKILWERVLLPRRVRADGCDVFLSLYQCPTIIQGVHHVMVVHDLVPHIFPQYLNNVRKRFYQYLTERAIVRADALIAISNHTRDDVVRLLGVPSTRITVQHIDCDPMFKSSPPSSEERHRILDLYGVQDGDYLYFGGGLDVRKNVTTLLRAYARLRTEKPCVVPPLVISGALMPHLAPLITDVERLVQEMDLSDHVRVVGFVPQEHLPALYAGAMVFVYPSLYEGFGLPVLEALSVGTPVVAGTVSSIPEVGGDAVEYCDPSDVTSLYQALRRVVCDKAVREALRSRAIAQSKRFAWKHTVHSVMETCSVDADHRASS